MNDTNKDEIIKITVEEFTRVQRYMIGTPENAESYPDMKTRYLELKVILQSSGINLAEIDTIKL